MNKHIAVLAITSGALLSGCATTGDPNAGGLFNWSESKAKQRQQNLQYQAVELENQIQQHKDDQLHYTSIKQQKSVETDVMEARLYKLLDENKRLKRTFKELSEKKSINNQQLQQLIAQLQHSKQNQATKDGFYQLSGADSRDHYLQAIEKENQQYADAILSLLED